MVLNRCVVAVIGAFCIPFVLAMQEGHNVSVQTCTMSDVKNTVERLKKAVDKNEALEAKEQYQLLNKYIELLHTEAKQVQVGSCNESGDEGCGDYYTEFIMRLNYILKPLRNEEMQLKLKKL